MQRRDRQFTAVMGRHCCNLKLSLQLQSLTTQHIKQTKHEEQAGGKRQMYVVQQSKIKLWQVVVLNFRTNKLASKLKKWYKKHC